MPPFRRRGPNKLWSSLHVRLHLHTQRDDDRRRHRGVLCTVISLVTWSLWSRDLSGHVISLVTWSLWSRDLSGHGGHATDRRSAAGWAIQNAWEPHFIIFHCILNLHLPPEFCVFLNINKNVLEPTLTIQIIHPSIICNRLSYSGSQVGRSRSQLTLGDGRLHLGQITRLSQSWHTETDNHSLTFTPTGHLESTVNLTCLSLDCGSGRRRKPTLPRGEHANYTQKDPNLNSNLRPSCCEATVLTTAPPCWPYPNNAPFK